MLNLSLEGASNRVELGIIRYEFTGISVRDYITLAIVSYSEEEFKKNLINYHAAREENIDDLELSSFCSFIFEENEASSKTPQDIFHAILEEVQEEHYDWGLEAQMSEANRLYMERGFGDFNEIE